MRRSGISDTLRQHSCGDLPDSGRTCSALIVNCKARKRNTIINFRVSPEEKERIDARIAMTGMDKAEFFIQSCLYQAILVRGNVRTFREFEREIKELAMQIDRNVKLEEMDPGQQESLRVILEVLEKLFGKER